MDIVPQDTKIPEELEDRYDGLYLNLSEQGQVARAFQRKAAKQHRSSKRRFSEIVEEADELIGGQPRYALWADQNYGEHVKVRARLATAPVSTTFNNSGPVQIICPIQRSSLDDLDERSADGKIINITPLGDSDGNDPT